MSKRPRVRIRFKYNTDTGEIEEFIIDDNAPAASEEYHNGVARAIAGNISRNMAIEDAGAIRLNREESRTQTSHIRDDESEKEKETNQKLEE